MAIKALGVFGTDLDAAASLGLPPPHAAEPLVVGLPDRARGRWDANEGFGRFLGNFQIQFRWITDVFIFGKYDCNRWSEPWFGQQQSSGLSQNQRIKPLPLCHLSSDSHLPGS